MNLVFTGTQEGMTAKQRMRIRGILSTREWRLSTIRHGGCIGADAQFHRICYSRGLLDRVVVHLSDRPHKRADLVGEGFRILDPCDPLVRNRIMVDASSHCIATPKEMMQITRSGTWATIRYAWKKGIVTTIVLPDGSTL